MYVDHEEVTMTEDYASSFLAYREVPHYTTLLKRLEEKKRHLMPQVVTIKKNQNNQCVFRTSGAVALLLR